MMERVTTPFKSYSTNGTTLNIEDSGELECYAIKLEPGRYFITGGAIKLTRTMQERNHTILELTKMEQVRNLLIEQGVVDLEGFEEYTNEL